MMSLKFLSVFLFSSFIYIYSYSQVNHSKFDIRIGSGISFMGTDDLYAVNIENELNYKISPYFASSIALHASRSYSNDITRLTVLVTNLNVFFSPFKNIRLNDFRIGSGFNFGKTEENILVYEVTNTGSPVSSFYSREFRNSFGYNLILENSININARLFIGLKAFSQIFFNEDINSGILLKMGVRI